MLACSKELDREGNIRTESVSGSAESNRWAISINPDLPSGRNNISGVSCTART
ncbi:hypothetical protein KIN20_026141 [Parelaphostrongylus tenuis]|uniref:Uncharacterized protein n=1 Tax=Parelaphostrongylus tenuis TaxID=148309 RepID=A0AAD5MZ82_PARTN|nr:hypothetical protein KIN20_026141 [Parelaphostrongylus tenuis]